MPHSRVMAASRRSLTETERRVIRAKIRSLSARGRRASTISFPIAGALILVLWIWTILASDAPWLVVTIFWIVVGGFITLWVRRDMRAHGGQLEGMAQRLEAALKRNEADVYDIRAKAFVEFEEIEDEGACYAFDIGDNQLVFVTGQEFYESARFPSLDFSLVYVLDETGQSVDMLIDKRRPKTGPVRTIPAAIKQRLVVPEHLEVRVGRIDNVERSLGLDTQP
jgi:hypothetical protein